VRLPDRMTCEELFRRLDDYLDRELEEPEIELIREHLETCATCVNVFSFEESVLRNVRQKVERIAAPSDLRGRISRAIKAAARQRER
jgi:anti-sigma factor (TIGR02949 family)